MNFKWFFIFALVAFMSPMAHAQTQFICSYDSIVKVTELNLKAPKAETKNSSERFTFLLEKDGTASYINLALGSKNRANVQKDGQKITFSEWNQTDNFFIATIFLTHGSQGLRPSVLSFHSWGKHEFYFPSLSLGTCVATNG
jgi:hypothetical protein